MKKGVLTIRNKNYNINFLDNPQLYLEEEEIENSYWLPFIFTFNETERVDLNYYEEIYLYNKEEDKKFLLSDSLLLKGNKFCYLEFNRGQFV